MTNDVAAPVADWIDPAALVDDPYPSYSRLRHESPVAFAPFAQSYLVSTYDGVKAVTSNPDVFVANPEHSGQTSPFRRTMQSPTLIDTDDPEHAANRNPLNPGLRPKTIKERWTGAFTDNARHYLDELAEAGSSAADLNAIASLLSTKNLMDVLGIHGVDVATVRNWSAVLVSGLGNVMQDPAIWERVDAVRAEVDALLDEVIPYLGEHPDNTFTSALVSAGRPIDSIKANVRLALSGGINEPQHAVTSIVWAFSENPHARAEFLADPELWTVAFEETLRWVSPVALTGRTALEDCEVAGVTVPEGSSVLLLLASANRDDSHFEDAAVWDMHRPPQSHFAFGAGAHQCAGAWIARWSIGGIAVPMLYERFEGLRNADDRAAIWSGFTFRGLTEHPVTWDRDRGNA